MPKIRIDVLATFAPDEKRELLSCTNPCSCICTAGRFQGGFSLLELLVVVVIIGLLASYVGPRLFGQIAKSERQVARGQIDAFVKALDTFRLDTGRYPEVNEGLAALVDPPQGMARWNGPYLQKSPPPDPWGRPYQYDVRGNNILVQTFGKDGQSGGSGEDADMTSEQ